MTLGEYRQKRKDIKKTHPAPIGLSSAQKTRHYSKIALGWIDELDNVLDAKIALKEERILTKKALND